MYHIATHNIGLGSYNDDFNRLMKDLLMKDHFVKGLSSMSKLHHRGKGMAAIPKNMGLCLYMKYNPSYPYPN